jgi:5-methylcytosine-specific restriction enzyme A
MRNPKWKRDEIILALDLYYKLEPGQMHSRNPDIIKLSELLNRLPIHDIIPDTEKFRNPNGVGLKLCNFLALDPEYDGKGMQSFSKLDKEIFNEFDNDRVKLKQIASQIKSTIDNGLNIKLYKVDDDENDQIEVKEGKVIYKLHKLRERNSKISKKKKSDYLKQHGKLDCEVCKFDFYETYGDLGKGFIECHHRTPLSDLDAESKTSLTDLALVCSNCHRMLHRKMDNIGIADLKGTVANNGYRK